jgi:hypothetical protein
MKLLKEILKNSVGFWSNPRKNWKWMLLEIACIVAVYFIISRIF